MNEQRPPNTCPECGAPLVKGAASCWLCCLKGAAPAQASENAGVAVPKAADTNPYASPAPPPAANLDRTFSLSTMFLWTTLVAVVAALARIAPGLAIAAAILCFPAALRTVFAVGRRKSKSGARMTVMDKIEIFLASFGIVLSIVIGAVSAFVATCFPIGLLSFDTHAGSILFAVVAGTVAGGVVAILLTRRLWRIGD